MEETKLRCIKYEWQYLALVSGENLSMYRIFRRKEQTFSIHIWRCVWNRTLDPLVEGACSRHGVTIVIPSLFVCTSHLLPGLTFIVSFNTMFAWFSRVHRSLSELLKISLDIEIHCVATNCYSISSKPEDLCIYTNYRGITNAFPYKVLSYISEISTRLIKFLLVSLFRGDYYAAFSSSVHRRLVCSSCLVTFFFSPVFPPLPNNHVFSPAYSFIT